MDELRWTLLGIGLLFVGGLAVWELRKPRHSGRDDDRDTAPPAETASRRVEPRFGDDDDAVSHTNSLPSMRAVDAGGDPPVIVLDGLTSSDADEAFAIASDVAIDSPRAAGRAPPALEDAQDEGQGEPAPFDVPTEAAVHVPDVELDETAPAARATIPRRGPLVPNWPPEDQRRIVSLRLVPRPPARFNGRSLRQAFEACGLEFGAFDIFHLADDAGEVVASAANLMRPGTFAPATMDAGHFHGVHLFCVLPGPLSAGRAVDELIALSRDLAQRVSGIVLDHVGQPLDEERAAAVRGEAEAAERGDERRRCASRPRAARSAGASQLSLLRARRSRGRRRRIRPADARATRTRRTIPRACHTGFPDAARRRRAGVGVRHGRARAADAVARQRIHDRRRPRL